MGYWHDSLVDEVIEIESVLRVEVTAAHDIYDSQSFGLDCTVWSVDLNSRGIERSIYSCEHPKRVSSGLRGGSGLEDLKITPILITKSTLALRKLSFIQVGAVVCDDWSVEDGKLLITNNRGSSNNTETRLDEQLIESRARDLLESIYGRLGGYLYTFGVPYSEKPYFLAEREELLFDRQGKVFKEIGVQSQGTLPIIEFIRCVGSIGFPMYVFSDVPFAENEFVRYCLESCQIFEEYQAIVELLSEHETVKAVAYMRDCDYLLPIEITGDQVVLDLILEHVASEYETLWLNNDSEVCNFPLRRRQFEIVRYGGNLSGDEE